MVHYFHLSFPQGDRVNDYIPKDPCSCTTKTDLKSAFRLIPVHAEDWHLLGICWQQQYYVYLYSCTSLSGFARPHSSLIRYQGPRILSQPVSPGVLAAIQPSHYPSHSSHLVRGAGFHYDLGFAYISLSSL